MKKPKLKVTLEEAFALGRSEGHREILQEVVNLIEGGMEEHTLRIYIKARLVSLVVANGKLTNPFNKKD